MLELIRVWVEGHVRVAPLEEIDRTMPDDFVMPLRFLLTAWITSHAELPTTREAELEGCTAGTPRWRSATCGDAESR